MKEQLKRLWKETFGDSDAFINLFFSQVYKKENVLTLEKEGTIISVIYMIPYQMICCGEVIPVSYICGVATIPEERGKGHMKQLMEKAHELLRNRGDRMAILIPAGYELFNYYSRFGYQTFFYYETEIYTLPTSLSSPERIKLIPSGEFPLNKIYQFLNRMLQQRECCVLHSQEDLSTILKDLHIGNGEAWITTNEKNEITALAFVYLSTADAQNTCLIKELVYTEPSVKEILLQSICLQYNITELTIHYPANSNISIPFGMAKILDTSLKTAENNSKGFMSLMLE